MKKKYTTPGIIKVELKPEQAVLGQCSTGQTNIRNASLTGCTSGCRQYNRAGDAAYRS